MPQQKVAHSHFAARADQQIGIRRAGGVEVISKSFLVDVRRSQLAGLRLGGKRAGGVHQLGAAAVAKGEVQRGAGVCIERRDGGVELLADESRQAIQLADRPQPDVVLIHLRLLGF